MQTIFVQCRASVQFIHAAVEQLAYKVRRLGMWITPQQREHVKRFLTKEMGPDYTDWDIGYSGKGIVLHRELPNGGRNLKTVTVWQEKPDTQIEAIALAPARQMWTATPKEEILETAGWLLLIENETTDEPSLTLLH